MKHLILPIGVLATLTGCWTEKTAVRALSMIERDYPHLIGADTVIDAVKIIDTVYQDTPADTSTGGFIWFGESMQQVVENERSMTTIDIIPQKGHAEVRVKTVVKSFPVMVPIYKEVKMPQVVISPVTAIRWITPWWMYLIVALLGGLSIWKWVRKGSSPATAQ